MGSDGNGWMAGAWYGGNRYYPAIEDVATLQATQPGTNSAVWVLEGAGASDTTKYREWTPGNTTDWLQGGAFGLVDDNSRSTAFGGYLGEPNQFPAVNNSRNLSVGGYRSAGVRGTGPRIGQTLVNFLSVTAGLITGRSVATAVATVISGVNTQAKANNVGAQLALYAGQKANGDDRLAANLRGRALGTGTQGTAATIRVLESGNEDAGIDAQEWNGDTKVTTPGADNAWGFGTSALRWAAGWMMNLNLFPGSSVTPTVNGQVTFELTNDTTLTFKVKGFDGTVRSGTVALS